jgi:cephalosporin hydroxylase
MWLLECSSCCSQQRPVAKGTNMRRWINKTDPVNRIRWKGKELAGALAGELFHRIYYNGNDTWYTNVYCGIRLFQYPGDLWLYQELLYRTSPAFIIQTGVAQGGSVLYLAHMLDAIGAAPAACVVGIDIELSDTAQQLRHPRIHLVAGDSTDPVTLRHVQKLLPAAHGMVSLDSDHRGFHALHEMRLYQSFVAPGCYMVVEDTNLNGHPVWSSHGTGPYEATEVFLQDTPHFVRDDCLWRRNLFSFHRHGWLRRVSPAD